MTIKDIYENKLKEIKHKVEMTDTHSLIWDEMFESYEQLLKLLIDYNECIEDIDLAIKDFPEIKNSICRRMLHYSRKRLEKKLNCKIPDDVYEKCCDEIKEEFKDE